MAIDILIKNATCVSHNGIEASDVAIKDDIIVAVGHLDNLEADEVIDATGLHLMPGVIDTQVNFREPEAKDQDKEDMAREDMAREDMAREDMESGSRAAVMGGVTAVFEMSDTKPLTTTAKALKDKVKRGTNRMWCDFAFYMGASAKNAKNLHKLERLPGCCGIKIFMGSTTGDLLVSDDQKLAEILSNGTRRIAIHAEDEDRLNERKHLSEEGGVSQHPIWHDEKTAYLAAASILEIARRAGRRIHLLHVTTEDEMALLAAYKDVASVEVTPHHLSLSAPECYEELGTFAQMDPPIRDEMQRMGLWKALSAGIVDVLGSGHVPHEREMKALPYPKSPSGMPGVQTMLPIMLDQVNKGALSLERLVDLTSAGPARLFNIVGKGRLAVGYDADLTIVDLKRKWTIEEDWLQSKCGWSPFTGRQIIGKPVGTFVRGRKVMWEGQLAEEAAGQPIRFQDTLNG